MNVFYQKLEHIIFASKKKWYILDRLGNIDTEAALVPRPKSAKNPGDDPYTPWNADEPHLHMKAGKITGIHAYGLLKDIRGILNYFISKEDCLKKIRKTSISLSEAKKYV